MWDLRSFCSFSPQSDLSNYRGQSCNSRQFHRGNVVRFIKVYQCGEILPTCSIVSLCIRPINGRRQTEVGRACWDIINMTHTGFRTSMKLAQLTKNAKNGGFMDKGHIESWCTSDSCKWLIDWFSRSFELQCVSCRWYLNTCSQVQYGSSHKSFIFTVSFQMFNLVA